MRRSNVVIAMLALSACRDELAQYADALLVRLPTDRAARARLFAIGGREAVHEGFDPEPDHGQRYLYFWWD